jgi:hypothetical protein
MKHTSTNPEYNLITLKPTWLHLSLLNSQSKFSPYNIHLILGYCFFNDFLVSISILLPLK